MNEFKTFNGSPTVDGYYTTFDSSEVHRIDESSEGGGGSSDFSTAEVTIVVNESAYNKFFTLHGFMCEEADNDYPAGLLYAAFDVSQNCIVPLYKGLSTWVIEIDGDNPVNVSCGGNAEFDTDIINITGDCTITVSGGR